MKKKLAIVLAIGFVTGSLGMTAPTFAKSWNQSISSSSRTVDGVTHLHVQSATQENGGAVNVLNEKFVLKQDENGKAPVKRESKDLNVVNHQMGQENPFYNILWINDLARAMNKTMEQQMEKTSTNMIANFENQKKQFEEQAKRFMKFKMNCYYTYN